MRTMNAGLGSLGCLLVGLGLVGCQDAPPVDAETAETGATSVDGPASSSGGIEPGTSTGSTGAGVDDATTGTASDGADATTTATDATDSTSATSGTDTAATTETGTTETDGTQPSCGDRLVEGDEACDDGGESALCNDDCTPAMCGDGILNATAGEFCDDGGESAACNEDCTSGGCGDGVLNETAGEQCDDGGESALCDVDCTPAACGDGIYNATAGEQCDDAGRSTACNLDCTLATCGDGVLNVMAGEACDDAGESASCNADCSPASCGDGITNLTAGESCDDAGESASCNADCSPASCGDGITNLAAGEACDDAGASAACDDDCSLALCGDLHVNPAAGEDCDGSLAGATCQSQGFDGGVLACGDGCGYVTGDCYALPEAPTLVLSPTAIKRFDFSWAPVAGADHYELLESTAPGEPFVQLGGSLLGGPISHVVPLHFRHDASYVLRACNAFGCTDSTPVSAVGSLAEAVGYLKASNTDAEDAFGYAVALSADGNTLAIGADGERSNATGIDGNQADDSLVGAGAVYVFVRDGAGGWTQQAYVKSSNPDLGDHFGWSVSISDDGNTLAVGAIYEDSNAFGVNGAQGNGALESGAAYVFVRNGAGAWSQQAYFKASNTGLADRFGHSVAISGDGNTLAAGAIYEDSGETGTGGNGFGNTSGNAGAVYVFARNGAGAWLQQSYVKASNTNAGDQFGFSVALNGDGSTLAVGAIQEDSNATGIGGPQNDNSTMDAGAVYVFTRSAMGAWSQQAYVKASNPGAGDYFGHSVALSDDGSTLAVGAYHEDSSATGIGGNQASNATSGAGAVYVLVRSNLGVWSQQAYVKASNSGPFDLFGWSVSLGQDGNVMAVGAYDEHSSAIGLEGDQADDSSVAAGAAYVLVRDAAGTWSQRAYVKASNTAASEDFGCSVAISGDGDVLAVGARDEDGGTAGIGGDQTDDSATNAGAVYLY